MRTTVDILEPLDEQLRLTAAQLGITFREALNRAIAAGLPTLRQEKSAFQVRAKACGWQRGIDMNHLNRLADEMEDEARDLP